MHYPIQNTIRPTRMLKAYVILECSIAPENLMKYS